jgi:hypothetical protein
MAVFGHVIGLSGILNKINIIYICYSYEDDWKSIPIFLQFIYSERLQFFNSRHNIPVSQYT